ncbi:A24 family peptidase [Sphingomonas morindae]|uniref:Prepilin peptidase n=1 Tax=Sphingomonas morindae TaxID=1541170 RepID=A0ABY4X525_9SPHN|nr:prepilin peptidase [Sphingomonas morindae]USI71940.1 prepilin peptidase [Sphingomonas morindae]
MHSVASASLALLLVAGLGYACWTDARARIIPNPLTAAIALAAPLWWWASGLALWPDAAFQIGIAAAALLLFLAAFALGAMGGGDVKLIAALGLWLAPLDFMRMLIWMALAGGLLTVAMLVLHQLRRAPGRPEIPYGLAIVAAALPIFAERYIYHFG